LQFPIVTVAIVTTSLPIGIINTKANNIAENATTNSFDLAYVMFAAKQE